MWSYLLVTQRALLCLRSYKPFVVAQIAGKPMDEAETRLRAYLGGANERRQRLDVTTPLWRNSEGAVFFALPGLQACSCAMFMGWEGARVGFRTCQCR